VISSSETPEAPISGRVPPAVRVDPIAALTLALEGILTVAEPPAGQELRPARGARATRSIVLDDPQFIVTKAAKPSHHVIIQVDPGVTEKVQDRAPDRPPPPHVPNHVPRSQELRAGPLYPAKAHQVKMRAEIPLKPIITTI